MQADSATETEEWVDTLRRAHILFQRSRPSLGKEKEEGFSEEEEESEGEKEAIATRPRSQMNGKKRGLPAIAPAQQRHAEV